MKEHIVLANSKIYIFAISSENVYSKYQVLTSLVTLLLRIQYKDGTSWWSTSYHILSMWLKHNLQVTNIHNFSQNEEGQKMKLNVSLCFLRCARFSTPLSKKDKLMIFAPLLWTDLLEYTTRFILFAVSCPMLPFRFCNDSNKMPATMHQKNMLLKSKKTVLPSITCGHWNFRCTLSSVF